METRLGNLGMTKLKKQVRAVKPVRAVSPPELPTAETLAKSEWREEHTSARPGAPKRLRNLFSSELDRLMFTGLISPDDHSILARFQRELKEAGLIFSVRSSIYPVSSSGSASFIADTAFARARRIHEQQQALAEGLYELEHHLLLAVLTTDQRLHPDGAPIMAKAAQVLARVYGL